MAGPRLRPAEAAPMAVEWRGRTQGTRAPVGSLGSHRGVPSWPDHASRRSAGGCSGGDGATAAAVAGKVEQKGRRTTGKVVAHTVGREGA